MSEILGPVAAVMGLLMALAPLLQVQRILRRRHADDLSQPFLLVIALGAGCWAAYGVSLGDVYLIVPNAVGVASNVGTVAVARYFQRLQRANAA